MRRVFYTLLPLSWSTHTNTHTHECVRGVEAVIRTANKETKKK